MFLKGHPGPHTRKRILTVAKQLKQRVEACGSNLVEQDSWVRAFIRISPSGKVIQVMVTPRYIDAKVADCVKHAVERATFPPSEQSAVFQYAYYIAP